MVTTNATTNPKLLNRAARRRNAFGPYGNKVMAPGFDDRLNWPTIKNIYGEKIKVPPPARIIYKPYTRKSRAGIEYTHYAKFIQHGKYKA